MKIDYLSKNIIAGFLILLVLSLLIFFIHLPLLWFLLILLPLGLVIRYVKIRTNKFAYGKIGENEIDSELKKLGTNFKLILNGIETGSGNIDKIVVGPTGVWVLEVKSHKGDVSFDGQNLLRNHLPFEKDFLAQAYAEAKYLSELIESKINLRIQVNPVIVFSDKYSKVRLGLNKYKGVYVIQKAWLNRLISDDKNFKLNETTQSLILNALKS